METVNYFKALADETRLRLANLSLHYELNVNEIVDVMNMGQSRISRHLKILTDNKMLTCRRDGMWTFYSAAEEGDGCRFVGAVKYLFEKESVFKSDLAGAKRVREERSKAMINFFDSIAGAWEKLKREIIGDVDINNLILQNLSAANTIVDLGCGTGDLLDALKGKAERLIGVEKSPKMLEEARRRFAGDGDNIDLRVGELEHLPLREEEAGLAVINMVLHHLPDPAKAFADIHRVLEKGGGIIIVDLLTHNIERMRERYGDRWLGFSKEDIEKWLEDSGFSLKKIEYFDLKKGLKGFIAQSVKK
ncbi:MAG: ArsR family transcriptional regulator [Candidatus Aminicenantes bacterium]|nr:ArsR family transcriptional regulator [Candidatus Aminicenantes bacterium]